MSEFDANNNALTGKVISLVVAIIIFAVVLVPIVSSLNGDGSGETHINPNTMYNMSYAEGDIPDFSIEFEVSGMDLIVNGQTVVTIDSSGQTYTKYLLPIYIDGNIILGFVGGGFMLYHFGSDGFVTSDMIGGLTGTIVCENNQIIITLIDDVYQMGGTRTFNAPDWCYYSNGEGDYGIYDNTQIPDGIYVSDDAPICSFGLIGNYQVYNDSVIPTVGFDTSRISSTYTPVVENGLMTDVIWMFEDGVERVIDCEYVSTLNPQSNGFISVAPHTVTSGSGSDSGTVGTLISIIPIFVALGILLAIIGMFYTKNNTN